MSWLCFPDMTMDPVRRTLGSNVPVHILQCLNDSLVEKCYHCIYVLGCECLRIYPSLASFILQDEVYGYEAATDESSVLHFRARTTAEW